MKGIVLGLGLNAFARLGLRARLMIIMGFMAVNTAVVGGVGYVVFHEAEAKYHQIARKNLPSSVDLAKMLGVAKDIRGWIYRAALPTSTPEDIEKIIKRCNDLLFAYGEHELTYRALPLLPGEQDAYDKVYAPWQKWKENALKLLAYTKEGTPEARDAFVELMNGDFRQQSNEYLTALGDLIELQTAAARSQIEVSEKTGRIATRVALGLTIGGVVSGLLIGFLFARALVRELSGIASSVEAATGGINEAAQHLSVTSTELSSVTAEAAASLEQTGATIEELTSQVRNNAESARQASELSAENQSAAQHGQEEMEQLIQAMAAISESAKQIEGFCKLIDSIAFQTNLLALNAAVEAARAGEQGRGFSVVAEEVRILAKRSAEASQEITALIEDSSTRIKNGTDIAQRSNTILHEIVASIHKVAGVNTAIANASHEQAIGIEQISQAVTVLEGTTQRNADSAAEVEESSQRMSEQVSSFEASIHQLTAIVHGARKQAS